MAWHSWLNPVTWVRGPNVELAESAEPRDAVGDVALERAPHYLDAAASSPPPTTEYKSAADVVPNYSTTPAWSFKYHAGVTEPMTIIEAMEAIAACTDRIIKAASRVRVKVMVGDEPAPDDHPLVELLKRPSPDMGWRNLVGHLGYGVLLTGGAYLHKQRARSMGPSAQHRGQALPRQIWPYFEGEITAKPLVKGEPTILHYVKGRATIQPRDVVRIMNVRPGDFCRGLSPIEAGQRAVSTDRAASEWQQVAMQNRGVPDALLIPDRPLKGDQYDNTVKKIKEVWANLSNAHLPLLMNGSLKWQDLSKSMIDLEFLEGRKFTRSQICMLLGVPEVLFDLANATYANLETAELSLWTNAAMHLVELVIEGLNKDLAPEYGADVSIVADTSNIDALVAPTRARWEAAAIPLKHGVPMSQVSKLFGLNVEPYPGWDVPLVANNLVPLSALIGSTETTTSASQAPSLSVVPDPKDEPELDTEREAA